MKTFEKLLIILIILLFMAVGLTFYNEKWINFSGWFIGIDMLSIFLIAFINSPSQEGFTPTHFK